MTISVDPVSDHHGGYEPAVRICGHIQLLSYLCVDDGRSTSTIHVSLDDARQLFGELGHAIEKIDANADPEEEP